jgi:hypothetical protein
MGEPVKRRNGEERARSPAQGFRRRILTALMAARQADVDQLTQMAA